jgi:hypothetical protein
VNEEAIAHWGLLHEKKEKNTFSNLFVVDV